MIEFIKVLFKLVKVENSMRTQVYIILLNYQKQNLGMHYCNILTTLYKNISCKKPHIG